MNKIRMGVALAALAAAGGLAAAQAQDASGVYNLGEIHVTTSKESGSTINDFGGSAISAKEIKKQGKESLDKAANLVPGVVAYTMGGTRNEQNIFVHGFDRWQVPLSIDGVRLYLPADNRIDFARFLTDDISEVQIAKSYVSVLDGPGGMGGAINLVTRKPEKPIEAEIATIVDAGRDLRYEGINTYARVGMKQDAYYLQASGAYRNLNGWDLSDNFKPTTIQPAGKRDNSYSKDWSANIKAGYTPNSTDEYSINFVHQEGDKGAPYNVYDPIGTQRYWTWPQWNVQTLSFLSNTKIGTSSYVKTKLYWNTFDNLLDSYDDPAQTTQSKKYAFDSYYRDWAAGGTVEAGHDFGTLDTLKASLSYRRDSHTEWNENFVNDFGTAAGCTVNVVCFTEPHQTSIEDTYSAALENTFHVTPRIDLVQGVGYDYRNLIQAEDYAGGSGATPGSMVYYPLKDSDAWNAQAAAIWHYSDTAKVFANISDRTRFPTLFERFSSRFGTFTGNADLKPERAINYQVGWSKDFGGGRQVSLDAFYADVTDMIQSVPVVINGVSANQSQNVGDGYYYGAEGSVDYPVNGYLALGGNLSLIRRHVNAPYIAGFEPTGVPEVHGMVYATLTPTDRLSITPTVEFASKRWTVNDATPAVYYQTGAYTLLNLYMNYDIGHGFSVSAGARNILDQNYALTYGFPEPGRSFFVAAKKVF